MRTLLFMTVVIVINTWLSGKLHSQYLNLNLDDKKEWDYNGYYEGSIDQSLIDSVLKETSSLCSISYQTGFFLYVNKSLSRKYKDFGVLVYVEHYDSLRGKQTSTLPLDTPLHVLYFKKSGGKYQYVNHGYGRLSNEVYTYLYNIKSIKDLRGSHNRKEPVWSNDIGVAGRAYKSSSPNPEEFFERWIKLD